MLGGEGGEQPLPALPISISSKPDCISELPRMTAWESTFLGQVSPGNPTGWDGMYSTAVESGQSASCILSSGWVGGEQENNLAELEIDV